jgi:hypothetical protein
MSIHQWLCTTGVAVCAALATAGAAAQTGSVATVSPAVLRESLRAESAKLTEWLGLVDSRRKTLIEFSANLGLLAGPARRFVSHVGPYEEQLRQQHIDNLVLLARLRRLTGAEDVEQFIRR